MYHKLLCNPKTTMNYLFVIVLVLSVSILLCPIRAQAASETEDNGTRATATAIQLNEQVSGAISSSSDDDWYKFTLTQDGRVNIQFTHQDLTSSSSYWRLYVYDANGSNITGGSEVSFAVTGDGTTYNLPELGLAKGTYYIKITEASYVNTSTYTIKAGFTATSAAEKEPNASRAAATSLTLNTAFRGSIYSSYDDDWYKFTLTQDGRVNIQFTHQDLTSSSSYWRLYVYDTNGDNITGGSEVSFAVTGDGTTYNLPELGLAKGTYYIKITEASYVNTSTYTIKAGFTATSAAEKEPNASRAAATALTLNTAFRGSVYSSYDDDWYKFTLTQDGRVNIQFTHQDLTSSSSYWRLYVYDTNGNNITGGSEVSFAVTGDGTAYNLPELGLAKGTYYIKITEASYVNTSTYTIKASFTATSAAEKEPNASRATATDLTLKTAFRGSIYSSYDEDYYRFDLSKADTVTIRFTHDNLESTSNYWALALYNSEGNTINIGNSSRYNVRGDQTPVVLSVGLSAGTYYMLVDSSSYVNTSTYTLTIDSPANNPVAAGWQHDSNGWWYLRADGTYPKNEWEKIDGKWYHFDTKGYMQTGWQKIGSSWYYLGTSGAMQTGWQKINNQWYYLNSSGVMQTGWQKIGSQWYHFNSSGVMQTSWLKVNNQWYYLNSSGVMQTGWLKVNNQWYYLNSSGVMQTGWQTISGKTYYFKSNGRMAVSEWIDGWWLSADGTWTYKYQASWKKDARGWWYGDSSGWYAKNATYTIDGNQYTFDSYGYLINRSIQLEAENN